MNSVENSRRKTLKKNPQLILLEIFLVKKEESCLHIIFSLVTGRQKIRENFRSEIVILNDKVYQEPSGTVAGIKKLNDLLAF